MVQESDTKAPEKHTPAKSLIEWYEGKLQYDRTWMDVSTVVLIRDTIHRLKELQAWEKQFPHLVGLVKE